MWHAHTEYLNSTDKLAADPDSRRILDTTVFLSLAPDGGRCVESGVARFKAGRITGARIAKRQVPGFQYRAVAPRRAYRP